MLFDDAQSGEQNKDGNENNNNCNESSDNSKENHDLSEIQHVFANNHFKALKKGNADVGIDFQKEILTADNSQQAV